MLYNATYYTDFAEKRKSIDRESAFYGFKNLSEITNFNEFLKRVYKIRKNSYCYEFNTDLPHSAANYANLSAKCDVKAS